MKRFAHTPEHKIEPTSFDLAVIEVVEYLSKEADRLNLNMEDVPNKKDILASVGISSPVWPLMVNHYRHVSTKPAKQTEIVKWLKEKYWINPEYIWNYPREKSMFLVSGIADRVNDDAIQYGYNLPSSAKLLRAELIKALNNLDAANKAVAELTEETASLREDLANLKLLVKTLKAAQNPDNDQ